MLVALSVRILTFWLVRLGVFVTDEIDSDSMTVDVELSGQHPIVIVLLSPGRNDNEEIYIAAVIHNSCIDSILN
jgi:hypothetical protein